MLLGGLLDPLTKLRAVEVVVMVLLVALVANDLQIGSYVWAAVVVSILLWKQWWRLRQLVHRIRFGPQPPG